MGTDFKSLTFMSFNANIDTFIERTMYDQSILQLVQRGLYNKFVQLNHSQNFILGGISHHLGLTEKIVHLYDFVLPYL